MIKETGLLAGAFLFTKPSSFEKKIANQLISSQHYTWQTFLNREGQKWDPANPQMLQLYKKTGLITFEPSFSDADSAKAIAINLKKHDIKFPSLYLNSALHDESIASNSIADALSIAKVVQPYGTKIIVTNPQPIKWGSSEGKNDKQLRTQAANLDELGKKLKGMGMTLAYHTHDMEMHHGAREFHHMLLNTSPDNVKLCLDAHWVYRGTGNSEVALFDIVSLYADRIIEVHLRQSKNGIWSETFGEGDIDYKHLAKMLAERNIKPLLVLEQGVEEGTPKTLTALEAIQLSLENLKDIFI